MQAHHHFLIGGTAAVLPDLLLVVFGWRKVWLSESHPLVQWHRFFHSTHGLITIVALAAITHIVVDWFSPHRKGA